MAVPVPPPLPVAAAVEALEPRRLLAAASVLVNFQPLDAPAPDGYLVDAGDVFADRGNGRSYGWNEPNAETRDRDAAASFDQRYDTLNHLQKPSSPNATWELTVPNGSYLVRLAAGDATYTDSVFDLTAEGRTVLADTPTAARPFVEATANVTVTDGRLTIGSGPAARNNKIAFVEVTPNDDVTRINGGSAGKVGFGGLSFVGSGPFVTGGINYVQGGTFAVADPAAPATAAIYKDEWTGGQTTGIPAGEVAFGYDVPVADGDYLVRLHFAELNKDGAGLRVFDVNVEGGGVELPRLDLRAETGYRNASVREFVVPVADGSLDVDFVRRVENAKVSAIEVLPLGPGNNANLAPLADTGGGGDPGGNPGDGFADPSGGTGVTGFIPLLTPATFDPDNPDDPATPAAAGDDEFYTFRQGVGYDEDEGRPADRKVFEVTDDGILHILGVPDAGQNEPFGYVSTSDEYRNYHLSLEYRWGGEKFNPRDDAKRDSGLLYHAVGPDRVWTTDVETQIQEGDTGDFFFLWNPDKTAGTVTVAPGTTRYQPGGTPLVDRSDRVVKSETVDSLTDWNRVEVIVEGDDVTVVVNGKVVNRASDLKAPDGGVLVPLTEGKIQLQAEGAEILYRNVEIKPTSAVGGSGAFDVLVFDRTTAFRHDTIDDAVSAIEKLGVANGFNVVATGDSADFNAANLARYEAVVFASTTSPRDGGAPLLDADQRAAFEDYIEGGGGFVGLHAAADAEYDWAWYGDLVGAYFVNHPRQQAATIELDAANADFPAVDSVPTRWQKYDEWYNYDRDVRAAGVKVLLTLDENTYDEADGTAAADDHPIAWYHDYAGGRSFYTGLGHRPENYDEPLFLSHLLGGIEYAAGVSRVAPADETVLFDGTDASAFEKKNGGGPVGWAVNADGELVIVPGTGDISTKQGFGDYRLHLEFNAPATAPGTAEQNRGNSGLYLAGSYELQILDSYGNAEYGSNDLGAIYNVKPGDANAALPAETWQSYDVRFTNARYDAAGNKTADARVTAYLNGRLVHDDAAIPGATFGGAPEGPGLRPIVLQDHDANSAVRFRNIWVQPTGGGELSASVNRVIFNDVKNGPASAAKTVTLTNIGTEAVVIPAGGITLDGPDASLFNVTSAPAGATTLAPGATLDLLVNFAPTAEGPRGALLNVAGDSAATPTVSVKLRGLGTDGLYGNSEPSLQYILDAYEIPVNVADPNPATGPIENFFASRPGDEQVKIELFQRAGDGPVTVEPLAVFSGEQNPDFRFGYYENRDADDGEVETFTVATPLDQTLDLPVETGSPGFDPGEIVFGLYTRWPGFDERFVASQAALNAFDGGTQKYAVYPLRDANGVVPSAYVVGVEEAENNDFQDLAFVVRNVRPADLTPGLINGRAWEDRDGPDGSGIDGNLDANDVPAAGVEVYLDLDGDFEYDAGTEPTTFSDLTGRYSFETLEPGRYNVAVAVVPPGFRRTGPDYAGAAAPVSVKPGDAAVAGSLFIKRIAPVAGTFQAEEATVGGGGTVDADHAGYTGSGFVNFNRSGGFVEFADLGDLGDGRSGSRTLAFRYALGSPSSRTVDVFVNGTRRTLTFAPTGGWDRWAEIALLVDLQPGGNVVRLQSTGQDGGNLDRVTLESA